MLTSRSAKRTRSDPSPSPDRITGTVTSLALIVVINAVLIGLFFDKAWIPSDDGHYVHVADRLVDGQVLNADVEEFHPGYIHFVHAASLELFGDEIVSLRYPLMALLMAQSLVVFIVFYPAGSVTATVAALTMSAVGPLQIANPTTSLYALGMTVALITVLARTTPETRHRALAIGILVGLVFLFRQLTAVFVAMGVLAFLFTEERAVPPDSLNRGFGVARAVLGLMVVGLLGYLVRSTDFSAGILFGLWPLLILGWAFRRPKMPNRAAVRLLAWLGVGAVISALPLIGYHLLHGSLGAWTRDVFIRSLSVTGLEHIQVGRYVSTVILAFMTPAMSLTLAAVPNALYWMALVFAAFLAGAKLFHRVRSLPQAAGVPTSLALPFVGVFYALVSVFNQIHYYLYLSAGLSIVSILWMISARKQAGNASRLSRAVPRGCVWAGALSIVAVVFHAGQPYTRTLVQSIAGDRVPLVKSELPHMGIWIDPNEERRLGELLQIIERETSPDDIMFTAPNNAELYFLSERTNGFRFFNPTISLIDEEDTAVFLEDFARVGPALIVHDTRSHYNTDTTADLIDRITEDFEVVATVDHYTVFTRR